LEPRLVRASSRAMDERGSRDAPLSLCSLSFFFFSLSLSLSSPLNSAFPIFRDAASATTASPVVTDSWDFSLSKIYREMGGVDEKRDVSAVEEEKATPSAEAAAPATGGEEAAAEETGKQHGDEEDTGAQIAPIVKLEEVVISTGEENEDVLLDIKAKLYRFDKEGTQWKERGVGQVKLLEHKQTKKVRLLMRQNRTLKICANHMGELLLWSLASKMI
jgi:hypothetical protein